MQERERFSVIENASMRKRNLEERLKDLPEVRARVERMLDLIENAAGDVEKAAEAERRVTEELRQMGSEVLHGRVVQPLAIEQVQRDRHHLPVVELAHSGHASPLSQSILDIVVNIDILVKYKPMELP